MLGDAQEKLIHQNQKFEAQLQTVRDRLEQARTQKSNQPPMSSFGRIAKPLRGGGVVPEDKRSSWISGFMNNK